MNIGRNTSKTNWIWWKGSFFLVTYFKKWNYIITCKVKHFKSVLFFLFWRLELTANESQKSLSQNIYIWVSINDHPYSINGGYLLFFETTIMGNTADLAMAQKTIIDTLHKEGKSQRVITERSGCSRSAVSKHIKCKVNWKEEIG